MKKRKEKERKGQTHFRAFTSFLGCRFSPPVTKSDNDPRLPLDDEDGEDRGLSSDVFLLLLLLFSLLLPPLVFVTLLRLVADSEARRRLISCELPLLRLLLFSMWFAAAKLLLTPLLRGISLGDVGAERPPLTLFAATSRREAAADPTPILTVEAEAAVLSARGGGIGEESGVSPSFWGLLLVLGLMGWGLLGLCAKRRSRNRCSQAEASDLSTRTPRFSNAKKRLGLLVWGQGSHGSCWGCDGS